MPIPARLHRLMPDEPQPSQVAPAPQDDRAAKRKQMRLAAEARRPGANDVPIVVHDLSATGFRAEGYLDMAEGAVVDVDLPGAGRRQARVAWQGGHYAGCAFVEPLTAEELASVVQAAPVVWGDFPRSIVAPRYESMRRAVEETPEIIEDAYQADAPLPLRVRALSIIGINMLLWGAVAAGLWAVATALS